MKSKPYQPDSGRVTHFKITIYLNNIHPFKLLLMSKLKVKLKLKLKAKAPPEPWDDFLARLKEKTDEDALYYLASTVIPSIHKVAFRRGVPKIFDNYFYRQLQMEAIMKAHWPNIVLNPARTGRDFWSTADPVLVNGEMKSLSNDVKTNPLSVSFPFDKQNDPERRKATLAYDAFVFAVLYDEKVRILVVAEAPDTVVHLNQQITKLQEKFVEKWEANIANGKRGGHDAIRLKFADMFGLPAVWHLYLDKTWYKNIPSEECQRQFQDFHTALERPDKKKTLLPRNLQSHVEAAASVHSSLTD